MSDNQKECKICGSRVFVKIYKDKVPELEKLVDLEVIHKDVEGNAFVPFQAKYCPNCGSAYIYAWKKEKPEEGGDK